MFDKLVKRDQVIVEDNKMSSVNIKIARDLTTDISHSSQTRFKFAESKRLQNQKHERQDSTIKDLVTKGLCGLRMP